MTARAAVFSLVRDDATLALEKVYAANSVDTPPEAYFAIIKWGVTNRVFENVGTHQLQIWVHDRNRDYGRINDALKRLKDLLTGTVHRVGADGETLATAEWNGESEDLFDGGYSTCTRYAEFTVVSR